MAHVLVIDDEEMARFTIREILESAAHSVEEAEDGLQGVSALAAGRFDLVICDIVMPKQEGADTIRKIKATYPRVKLIAVSGGGRVNNIDHLDRARAAGADAVLGKPFADTDLTAAIDSLDITPADDQGRDDLSELLMAVAAD